jgi:capsular polysaccharide transport system ATP-binding protein
MILADRISKSFSMKGGRRAVLRDLSFEVQAGSHFAILGGKGSGKSTILNLIGGLDHPDKGRIRCRGTVSWPFGQMRFERSMSVNQNIRFLCRVLGERDFDRVRHEVCEMTGFDTQLSAPHEQLRPIEQRSLTHALSLTFDFDVMLLDGRPIFHQLGNPEAFRQKFDEKISRSTVVMTAENPEAIMKSCRNILVLDGQSGRLYDKKTEAIEAFCALNNVPASQGDDRGNG